MSWDFAKAAACSVVQTPCHHVVLTHPASQTSNPQPMMEDSSALARCTLQLAQVQAGCMKCMMLGSLIVGQWIVCWFFADALPASSWSHSQDGLLLDTIFKTQHKTRRQLRVSSQLQLQTWQSK